MEKSVLILPSGRTDRIGRFLRSNRDQLFSAQRKRSYLSRHGPTAEILRLDLEAFIAPVERFLAPVRCGMAGSGRGVLLGIGPPFGV